MIAGLVQPFNVVSGRRGVDPLMMAKPGCFVLDAARPITLCVDHETRFPYASTADGTLKLWQDDRGLWFEATPAATAYGLALLNGIARGSFDQVSPLFAANRSSTQRIDGAEVEVVRKAEIGEISLVAEALCPGTAAWLADADPDALPPHAARVHARWSVSKQAAALSATRARNAALSAPRAQQRPSVPRSVLAAMSDPGWTRAAAMSRAAMAAYAARAMVTGK